MLDNWVGKKGTRYSDFVWRAATRSSIFERFRREAVFAGIMENVTPDLGREFLGLISSPLVREICLDSEPADRIGSPRIGLYEGRKIAPSTLRYGKIADDIIRLFPDFDSVQTICEIGGGYGGQARILCEYASRKNTALRSYTLVDLPEVLMLAKRYLSHFQFRNSFSFCSKIELDEESARCDFAMSNYAFSEFGKSLQSEYLDKILRKARCGILIMNSGAPRVNASHRPDVHSQAELLQLLPNAELLEEAPLTSADNYVIVYGKRDAQIRQRG